MQDATKQWLDVETSRQALATELAAAEEALRASSEARLPQRLVRALKKADDFPKRRASSMLAPTTSSCCRTEERAGEAVDAVQLAKQSENDAKRRMAELQRKLSKRKAAEERKKVEQQKQEVAREIRSFARNDKLRKMLQGASAASDEDMQELSLSFNLRMHELFNDASDAS